MQKDYSDPVFDLIVLFWHHVRKKSENIAVYEMMVVNPDSDMSPATYRIPAHQSILRPYVIWVLEKFSFH